jgi:hypothetical protein
MKFHIERLYWDTNLFDVMLGCVILGNGNELLKTVEFPYTTLESGENDCTYCDGTLTVESIMAAASWCRELGYKTYTNYDGWIDGKQKEN